MPTRAFTEGSIAYLEDRLDVENPYLIREERSKLKDDWNTEAQQWDDGYHNARDLDTGAPL